MMCPKCNAEMKRSTLAAEFGLPGTSSVFVCEKCNGTWLEHRSSLSDAVIQLKSEAADLGRRSFYAGRGGR